MNIDELVEDLTVRINGALVSQICLDFTIYTRSNFFADGCPEGVIDFYKQVIDRFGPQFRWYETENSTRPYRVDANLLDMFPFWFSGESKKRRQYILILRDGEKQDDIRTTSFDSLAYGKADIPGYLRLTLPAAFISKGVEDYINLCTNLVRKLPFLSGRAGYSLRWNEYGAEYYRLGLKHAELIAKRYPGIDLPDDSMTVVEPEIRDAIRPINWLTFLGWDLVEKMNGVNSLKDKLGNGISVFELPHGILIQAGQRPATGDTNKGIDLPEYKRVANALKGIRMRKHRPIVEDMDSWLSRFDNEEVQ